MDPYIAKRAHIVRVCVKPIYDTLGSIDNNETIAESKNGTPDEHSLLCKVKWVVSEH
jgi:hypothetical protein